VSKAGRRVSGAGRFLAAVVLLGSPGPGFAQSQNADQPVWTDRPVRIDRDSQEFERIVPRAPAESQTEADRFTLRFTPRSHLIVLDSVSFTAAGTRYRLSELEPVASSKICRDKDGVRWACGLRARASLSGQLTAQAVRCAPEGKSGEFEMVECRHLGRDLGEAQVRAGHAIAPSGSRYAEMEAAAKAASEGIWADVEVPDRAKPPVAN